MRAARFALLSVNRAVAAHSPRNAHLKSLAQPLVRNRGFPLHFARDRQFPRIRQLGIRGIRGIGLRYLQSLERLGQVELPTLFIEFLLLLLRIAPFG